MDTSQHLNKWYEQELEYTQRDLLTYACGIGCNEERFLYEYGDGFQAFPIYPLALMFKGTDADVVDFPSPAMDQGPPMVPLEGVKTGLDGERYVEMLAPLDPSGGRLKMKSRIIGVHARGSGASVETEAIISDFESGKQLYRIVSGAFLVGAKNFKDSGVTNSKKVDVPTSAPTAFAEIKTNARMPALYRLSGDYNPLHIDPMVAQMSGFKAPIMHGLCNMGITTNAVLEAFPDREFHSIRCRFASPVLPGDTLLIDMWAVSKNEVVFNVKSKDTNKVCISNASLTFKPKASM